MQPFYNLEYYFVRVRYRLPEKMKGPVVLISKSQTARTNGFFIGQ